MSNQRDHAGPAFSNASTRLPPQAAAAMLAGLLEQANSAMEHDLPAARRLIARASAMLREEEPTTAHEATGGLAPWQERRVREHVAIHLGTTLRIEALACVARLSASYFKRAFKVTFAETPHGYIRRMRLEQAKRMMLEGHEPLAQIALACGLADQAHLSRLFRDATGSSPSAWRRRHTHVT